MEIDYYERMEIIDYLYQNYSFDNHALTDTLALYVVYEYLEDKEKIPFSFWFVLSDKHPLFQYDTPREKRQNIKQQKQLIKNFEEIDQQVRIVDWYNKDYIITINNKE